jgi:hypothetical protein
MAGPAESYNNSGARIVPSTREPPVCRKAVKQQKSSENAQCNDHDGLSLGLRHLTLPNPQVDIIPDASDDATMKPRALLLPVAAWAQRTPLSNTASQ